MPQLFVSYPRENKREANELVGHLQSLNCEVWVDSSLRGGQTWWDEIIHRIADCDAFIAIVSHATLNSAACRREREWALKLNKPVLPVAVEHVLETALPRDLSTLQIIDYSKPGAESAFAVAGALAALGPAPPLPEKWPDPPSVPLSYLADLVDRVSQDELLTQGEQRRILEQLETALRSVDSEEQQGGQEILDRFSKRQDLFADVDRKLSHLRAQNDKPPARQPTSGAGTFELGIEGRAEPAETVDQGSLPPRYQPPPSKPVAPQQFYQPLPHQPPPPRRKRARLVTTIVATLAVIGGIVASVLWVVLHNSQPSGRERAMPPAEAQTRLSSLLPADYRDICKPGRPPPGSSLAGALAFVECHQGSNPRLPPNAAYALLPDKTGLEKAWDKAVRHDRMADCPGNRKSPDTYPEGATLDTASGMLACAYFDDRPEVMWTDESNLLFGAVWAEPQPQAFDQLYGWWARRY